MGASHIHGVLQRFVGFHLDVEFKTGMMANGIDGA